MAWVLQTTADAAWQALPALASAATTRSSLPLEVAAVLLSLLAGWALLRRLTMQDLHRIPSPPGAVPLLGHVLPMCQHVEDGHVQFLAWHEAHGPIVRIRLLHRDIVLVSDPLVAAQVLSKGPNEAYKRTPEYATFDVAHGMRGFHAIMTEQDEERWRAVRRTIAPAYGPAAIREAFPAIVRCYADGCRRIAAAATPGAGEVCIDEEVFAATICVMAEGFLRMPPGALAAAVDCRQVAADVASLVATTNTFVSQPWKQWAYLALPNITQGSRAFHAQRNALMALTDSLARHVEAVREQQQRQQQWQQEPAAKGAGGSSDAAVAGAAGAADDSSLVACLARLKEPRTGDFFSHEALQAELFLETVGQESIPWTAAWALFLITQHPEAEAGMLEELRGAGLPCDGDVDAAAAALSLELAGGKASLPYCTAVLREAMRMFPAGVAATPRMCHQPTQVGPYTVPAGVIVFPCLYSILMYSGNWDQPQEFRPERWLDNPDAANHPDSRAPRFIPFGVGPKACIAQQLAYVQLKVLLALLVSCFSWQLAPRMGGAAGVMAQCVAALELRVDQGMWLVPQQRTAKGSSK